MKDFEKKTRKCSGSRWIEQENKIFGSSRGIKDENGEMSVDNEDN